MRAQIWSVKQQSATVAREGFNAALIGFNQMKSRRSQTDVNVRAGGYARHLAAEGEKWNARSA
jgi:hypothetical protein